MSADLKLQLREYTEHFVSTVEPVQLDEIEAIQSADALVQDATVRDGWQPISIKAAVAVAVAAIAVAAAVFLLSRDSEQPPPTSTLPPTTTSMAPPPPGSALEAVSDAFGGIHDVEFVRFFNRLDRDECTIRMTVDDSALPCFAESLQPDPDLDFDGDGLVTHADQFVLAAHYLALEPIEILRCRPLDDGEACLVADTAVFHRALGIAPDPFEVAVRDGLIVEIRLGSPHGTISAVDTLGGCSTCGPDPDAASDAWEAAQTDYMSFLGRPEDASDPMFVGWLGVVAVPDGFGWIGWMNDEAIEAHREMVREWVDATDLGTRSQELSETVRDYIDRISAEHPAPTFDTSRLGTEVRTIGMGSGSVVADRYGVTGRSEGSSVSAAYLVELVPEGSLHGLNVEFRVGEALAVYDEDDIDGLLVAAVTQVDETFLVAVGGLPPEAAVVATELTTDGSAVWQRPYGGLVVFDAGDRTTGELTVLDESGVELSSVTVVGTTWQVIEPD